MRAVKEQERHHEGNGGRDPAGRQKRIRKGRLGYTMCRYPPALRASPESQWSTVHRPIRCAMRCINYAKAQVPNLVVPREGCHARERRVLSFGSLVLPVLVLDHLGLTGGHEHAVHDGSLSPISYPPDRMVPLSDRRRSGVASNFASKLHTPQSPSHSLLDCIHPGEVDCP